ncbi:GAP family protein [Actinomycetospora chiangmaiensis]|uniref:GAP family protein n=1 Tax=Actinomycetospora chiangmaiensis TaxID=402650 RepID=UPI000365A569|nr:GAP family protein [Actinomycetospora chiangmaiensis]
MLSEAVPAAFGAALYPPALLFVAFLLVNPQPWKRALIFLAGAVIATLGVGFAVVFILQGTGVERDPHHRTVPAWVDLAIGVLLVGAAIYVWFRPPRGPKAATERKELDLLGLLAVGLVMYSPSPLYLAALHAIAKAHAAVLVTILSVLLVAAIYMLVVEIPVVAHAIWPETTIRAVTAVNAWLGRHGRTIVVLAAGAFGVYLIVAGTVHLVTA